MRQRSKRNVEERSLRRRIESREETWDNFNIFRTIRIIIRHNALFSRTTKIRIYFNKGLKYMRIIIKIFEYMNDTEALIRI